VLAVAYRDQVRDRFRHAATGLLTGAGLAAIVLAYPAWFALFGPQHVRIRGPAEIFSADLLGPITPTSNQLLTTPALADVADRFSGGAIDFMGRSYVASSVAYLGLPLVLILFAIVTWQRRLAVVRLFAFMTVLAFVASLGPTLKVANHVTGIPMPARALSHLPPLDATLPYRYALFVALGAAVLLSVGVDRLHERSKQWERARLRPRLAAPLVSLAALVPLIPALPYSVSTIRQPEYFRSTAASAIPSGSVVLLYPFPGPWAAETMVWQAQNDFHYRMVGGYQFVPAGGGGYTLEANPSITRRTFDGLFFGKPATPATPTLRRAILEDLRRWDISTVVIDLSAPGSTAAVKLFADVLGRSPRHEQGVAIWSELPFGGRRLTASPGEARGGGA
jgi:hypothetical protein